MLLKRTSSLHLSNVLTLYTVLDFEVYDLIVSPVSMTVPKQSQYTTPFSTYPTLTTKHTNISTFWSRHDEKLNDLYSSPNIVWVVKSRRMRWAEHVARMVEERGVHRVLVGKPKGKGPLGRWMLRKLVGSCSNLCTIHILTHTHTHTHTDTHKCLDTI
jgi:hypothetical protein